MEYGEESIVTNRQGRKIRMIVVKCPDCGLVREVIKRNKFMGPTAKCSPCNIKKQRKYLGYLATETDYEKERKRNTRGKGRRINYG